MNTENRIALPLACEKYGLNYFRTRCDYMERKIRGCRDERGRIMLFSDSIAEYAEARLLRAVESAA